MDPYLSGYSIKLFSRFPEAKSSRGNVSAPYAKSTPSASKGARKVTTHQGRGSTSQLDSMKALKEKARSTRRPVIVNVHEPNENTRSIKAQAQSTRNSKGKPKHVLPGFLYLPLYDHIKTGLLLFLCSMTFPFSLALAVLLTIIPPQYIEYLFPSTSTTGLAAQSHRSFCRVEADFKQRTVLVTGVGMTKGLTLARAFWLCGHHVVAADFDANRCGIWTPWKGWTSYTFSCAFDSVYSLRQPKVVDGMSRAEAERLRAEYVNDICDIVVEQGVDLWVSCSGVASAVEDAMVMEELSKRRKSCVCIQFDVSTTSKLHEKSSFIRYARDLGLLVPKTHDVVSQGGVLRALAESKKAHPERKFILKPVGMDDANRGNMTLLPLPKPWETEAYVRRLPISKDRPWILQQFIRGGREYCTHAVVVHGQVKVFTACPSSELLMHYQKLAKIDPLALQMYDFSKKFAVAGGSKFTGHLSFDFMAEDNETGGTRLYAIECNPRAHTAVALFADPGTEMRMMVKAYMSAIDVQAADGDTKSHQAYESSRAVAPCTGVRSRYWIGHDVVALVMLPLLGLLRWQVDVGQLVESARQFVDHAQHWKDASFELWDPWPMVALYYHYWPKAIVSAWWNGQRWSRVNVSTTKMFAC